MNVLHNQYNRQATSTITVALNNRIYVYLIHKCVFTIICNSYFVSLI